MSSITPIQIREKWYKFFGDHDHHILKNKSVIPENDTSLLFVNSGVSTIKDFFTGAVVPPYPRLVNIQRVIRTDDIENVGLSSRHHTFFEMMGNFSIGNYHKTEAINLGFDFLTKTLDLEIERLFVTVFEEDEESYQIWLKLLKNTNKIMRCGKDRNFWDLGCGPCGPCTEIYYDRGEEFDDRKIGISLLENDEENDRYIEVWNIVFSELFNNKGTYTKLTQNNVDTGMGFERLVMILEKVPNVFQSSLFKIEMKFLLDNCSPQEDKSKHIHIILDHLRSVVVMLSDGVQFKAKGRGSVLRKMYRKLWRSADHLGLSEHLKHCIDLSIDALNNFDNSIGKKRDEIQFLISKENKLFSNTLKEGVKKINQLIKQYGTQIPVDCVFELIDRHGVPKELVKQHISFSETELQELMIAHQQKSKSSKFGASFDIDQRKHGNNVWSETIKHPSNFLGLKNFQKKNMTNIICPCLQIRGLKGMNIKPMNRNWLMDFFTKRNKKGYFCLTNQSNKITK